MPTELGHVATRGDYDSSPIIGDPVTPNPHVGDVPPNPEAKHVRTVTTNNTGALIGDPSTPIDPETVKTAHPVDLDEWISAAEKTYEDIESGKRSWIPTKKWFASLGSGIVSIAAVWISSGSFDGTEKGMVLTLVVALVGAYLKSNEDVSTPA